MRILGGDDIGESSGDTEDFVEAADELAQLLDVESGALVRHLTRVLRKQAEFRRLKAEFDTFEAS